MSSAASTPSSSPLRVLLIGVGGQLSGALANGLLQAKFADKIKLSVLSRPLGADATDAKKSVIASLKERGATVLTGVASSGAAALVPLFRDIDVVVSSLGTPAQFDQRVFIEAAKLAGVQWFIPSWFGFDAPNKGGPIAVYNDSKVDDLAAIKAAGMDWTVVHTGAFSDYMTHIVFGVDPSSRTITFPGSGAATVTQTPLADVGNIVGDLIATGRGRNQVVHTGAATMTFEEYAQLLEKVTGKPWTRVTKTKEESEAQMKANPWPTAVFPYLIAAFELVYGTNPPNSMAAWPVDSTYNHKHNIPMHSIEDIIRNNIKA